MTWPSDSASRRSMRLHVAAALSVGAEELITTEKNAASHSIAPRASSCASIQAELPR